MTQIVVHNLDADVKSKLRRRAQRHGRSMEAEVREILRAAVIGEDRPHPSLGSRLAAHFARVGLTRPIPELRGQRARTTTAST